MDLENEELKTTRKLNGVAKESNIDKLIKLKEISKRFNNGTETIEDIMYYCRNYEIKFENGLELRVVEKRYFDKLVERIKELEEENHKILENGLDVLRDTIPVQKVKDKIENLRYNSSLGFEETLEESFKIEALEELLEDK